jgi:hypothetical protein
MVLWSGDQLDERTLESRHPVLVAVATMMPSDEDADWKAAEAALEAACRLPGGSARIEALKHAGRLRFEADRKRLAKETGQQSSGPKRSKPIRSLDS